MNAVFKSTKRAEKFVEGPPNAIHVLYIERAAHAFVAAAVFRVLNLYY